MLQYKEMRGDVSQAKRSVAKSYIGSDTDHYC